MEVLTLKELDGLLNHYRSVKRDIEYQIEIKKIRIERSFKRNRIN